MTDSGPAGATNTLLLLLTAASISVVVGLLTDQGWPGLVIGAILALSLWGMLFFGSFERGKDEHGVVPAAHYAPAAGLAVLLGYLFFTMLDDNGAAWAIGFILAGVPLAGLYSRASRNSGETR